MKKKGFTLVELLAVIAILAILVIIALPNVMGMFNTAKKNSFMTEVKEIFKIAEQQWVTDSIFASNDKIYTRCGTCSAKSLDLTGRKELDYYIKLNKAGAVTEYYATDGTYQFSYSGSGLVIEDINNVVEIASIQDSSNIISISNDTVSNGSGNISGGGGSTSLTSEEIEELNLVVNYDIVQHTTRDVTVNVKLEGSSSNSKINQIEYRIYKTQGQTPSNFGELEYYNTIISTNKAGNFAESIDGGSYQYGIYAFKFKVDAYLNGTIIKTKTVEQFWCFVAGTKVLTENGYKNIEDIKVGEKVYSYNLDNNALELKEVIRTLKSNASDTIKMTIGTETVEMTNRHELYIIDKGWVRAYNVKVGDQMLDSKGDVVTISKIENIHYDEPIPTYNLEVDGNHNYFVTNIQVLVHNAPS